MGIPFPRYFRNYDAERIDVAARIKGLSVQLLRGSIDPGPGRSLVDIVVISVGQTEIYNLDIISVVRDDDVLGLQVSVDNLLVMHIVESIAGLEDNLAAKVFVEGTPGCYLPQSAPVHPLHFYAAAEFFILLIGYYAADIGMVQPVPYFEFLAQKAFESGVSSILRFQCLIDAELAILAAAVYLAESEY